MTNTMIAGSICCLALSHVLQNKVLFPGNSNYTSSLGSYFSLQESAFQPSCIVQPQSTGDVAAAVRALTDNSSTIPSDSKCQFAIRSGGHASFAGAANIQNGVTLDLSTLNSISLVAGGDVRPYVSVGTGAAWGSVYSYLEPHNLSVSGARASDVGVGGLLLGGGISYFGPQFGWACDAVTNIELVLANGSIVNANENENADLLWALRGGTNNFGVVTQIQLQTFEQGDLWGGFVDRPYSTADAEIAALAAFSNPATYDDFASLITTFAYSGTENTSVIVNNMEYAKPMANPAAFENFTSLSALYSTQRIAKLSDLTAEVAKNDPDGKREATATLTILPTVAAINATVHAWEVSLSSVRAVDGIVWSMGFDLLPPALYARQAHANALGLGDRGGKALLIAQLTVSWTDAADDGIIDTVARELISVIQRDVDALGALDPFVYINYAAAWQDPFAGYGEESLDKLRQVRRRYDPQGIFAEMVPGGFSIPA